MTPPVYCATGSHRFASSVSKATSSRCGDTKRRKYHEESKNVSIVSVSRVAGPPHVGQVVATQSVAPPSGEVPLGVRSRPAESGSRMGSWSSGTATSPCSGQWTIGNGVPQYR